MRALHIHRPDGPSEFSTDHLSVADVAAYIDGAVSPASRDHVEAHLAECARCRDELVACARLNANAPVARRWSPMYAAAGVIAAGVIVAAILRPALEHPRGEASRERAAGPAVQQFEIASPRDGAEVSRDAVRLAWHPDPDAAAYRVVVTTVTGAPVWRIETRDTTVVTPADRTSVAGAEYFWHVDVARLDGTTRSSRTSSFRVAAVR